MPDEPKKTTLGWVPQHAPAYYDPSEQTMTQAQYEAQQAYEQALARQAGQQPQIPQQYPTVDPRLQAAYGGDPQVAYVAYQQQQQQQAAFEPTALAAAPFGPTAHAAPPGPNAPSMFARDVPPDPAFAPTVFGEPAPARYPSASAPPPLTAPDAQAAYAAWGHDPYAGHAPPGHAPHGHGHGPASDPQAPYGPYPGHAPHGGPGPAPDPHAPHGGYASPPHGYTPPPHDQPGFFGHAAAALQSAKERRKHDRQAGHRPIPNADATAGAHVRLRFIRRTYVHLLGAILAFAGLLYLLMTNAFLGERISAPFVKFAIGGRWNWGVVLAVFMVVSWVADYWARHARSRAMQYAGLGLYVIAEAVIFVPLLAIVEWKTRSIVASGGGDPHIVRDAAYITLGIFSALTLSVFLTRKDFSFLRSGLVMASGAAMMLIVLSLVFGFQLGLVFSFAMVFLAAAYILYQTSQVLAHYDPDQHVAASLALFSSVALMFWYVIRIVMRLRE